MALTKEEKKARKEAKKLEKLRLEAEKKKQMRRDELQREIAAQTGQRKGIEKTFRETMLRIKEPMFIQEIEVMWHTFERTIDKKDHLIHTIMKLIDVADDQFQRTVASFCDTIDTMITKFLQDLEIMHRQNDTRTGELLKWGNGVKESIIIDQDAAELHLHLLLYHAHVTADNNAWNARGEFVVKEDEERSKFLNIREDLTSYLENSYNSLWEEYKGVLKNYVLATAENQKQVRRLRHKENMMADIIASQAKKIAMSDGILKRLRSELSAYETGTKQAVFRDRRKRHRDACKKLKDSFLNGLAVDEKKMNLLVKFSDQALEVLVNACAMGEKILRISSLCRKHETRREKVLPFGSDLPAETIAPKATTRRQTVTEDPLTILANSACAGLNRLWQRIAKAELTKRALLREKALLERENAMICAKLEGYQQSQSVGAGTGVEQMKLRCYCEDDLSLLRPINVDGCAELRKYAQFRG